MAEVVLNTGDTAWVLASTALVLLMTPGLALFYGGMVRAKSVLNMMLLQCLLFVTSSSWAQSEKERLISGSVKGQDNSESLVGVNITIKGTGVS